MTEMPHFIEIIILGKSSLPEKVKLMEPKYAPFLFKVLVKTIQFSSLARLSWSATTFL